MTTAGWIAVAIVALVISIVIHRCLFGGPNNAMGYTSEHGYCPNMGVCNGCDVCEED